MYRNIVLSGIVIVFALAFVLLEEAQGQELKKVRVNGVELQYIESGSGPAIVFVHGGLDDYRYWKDEMLPFSQHYRVISYSRRYNYPNNNLTTLPNYSASVDADDLAALITSLKLGRVHVVGASYGAYAALILAKKHPEMVRTLVLAEAPVLRLAQSAPNGAALYDDFMTTLWQPVGAALRAHEDELALKLTIEHFLGKGTYDQVPKDILQGLRANLREWLVLTMSSDVFPALSRTDLKKIKTPVLMLNGEHTDAIDMFVDRELWPLLRAEHVLIPNATHDMWNEQPAVCEKATLAFLARN
ncbi:MAG TPA: alpha/beta hydrolase [Pyrinomonadaceae bacterium]|nr:alpha/beta hydrolase [Pyrinomonadaceae bacterium]